MLPCFVASHLARDYFCAVENSYGRLEEVCLMQRSWQKVTMLKFTRLELSRSLSIT